MPSDFMSDEPTEEQLWAMLPEQIGVAKVSTLIDLTNATASKDEYGYALSIADTSVETAVEERDEQVLAKALVTRAHVYWHLERFHECGEDNLRAAELFERFDSLLAACRSYYDAAKAYYFADLNEPALDLNSKAVDLAKASEDVEAIGRCLLQKARLEEELGSSSETVMETLAEARTELRKGQLSHLVMECDQQRFEVLAANDRFDEALDVVRNLTLVAETIEDSKGAYFNYMMGRLLRQTHQPEAALPYLSTSAELNKAVGDFSGLASVLAEQARALRTLQRYDEALDIIAKAKALFDTCGLDQVMFSCDMMRIHTLRSAGRIDDAMSEAHACWDRTTDPLERFVIDLQIAENFFAQERYSDALTHLEGLTIQEEWEGNESAWFTYQRISAAVLYAQGDRASARLVAQTALAMPKIMETYPENRSKLRELAEE